MSDTITEECYCRRHGPVNASCSQCLGTGRVERLACKRCGGLGLTGNSKCLDCRGMGWRPVDTLGSGLL